MASNVSILGIYSKLSKLTEIKRTSQDRLKSMIKYTFEAATYKPIKICYLYVFCQYSFATLLVIYHLLKNFDGQTLLRHGSFCGIQIYVLLNMGSLLFVLEDYVNFLIEYGESALPIELLNGKKLKGVIRTTEIIKLLCSVNMGLAILAAAGFIAAPEYFDKKTYLCVWIEETFTDISGVMLHVVHWTSLPVALALAGTSVGFAYGSCTAIFQLLVLQEMIDDISNSSIPQKFRRNSELYQEVIRQKMIISVTTYEYIVRCNSLASDILEPPMVSLAIGSLILGGSLMMEFLSNQDQNLGDQWEIYIGILCFTLSGIISTNLYLMTGQAIEDESEIFNFKLSQLPWYDMNMENRKIYSIFLYLSKKNLGISNSIIQLDFNLLRKIIRGLYSLAAVLTRFVASNTKAE